MYYIIFNVSFQKLHNLEKRNVNLMEKDDKTWFSNRIFLSLQKPAWMVGRIQLTSAVLPLIMNEDVENVEE